MIIFYYDNFWGDQFSNHGKIEEKMQKLPTIHSDSARHSTPIINIPTREGHLLQMMNLP